jgi:hypothetical protein
MSRREQWKVDAQARELGEARELGAYRHGYESGNHGLTQRGWGGFLIGLGLLAGIPFGAQASGHAQAALFGVVGVMVAVGVVLIRTAPWEKADRHGRHRSQPEDHPGGRAGRHRDHG